MIGQTSKVYLYGNLLLLSSFNETTTLRMNEQTRELFVVKEIDDAAVAYYAAAASIQNEHLVPIRYVGTLNGKTVMVRDYISGRPLSMLLNGGKVFSANEAVRIAREVALGLDALHRARLAHRDINPNNIIITTDGHARIIDFGIMRQYGMDQSHDTRILGTVGYAAPEQFGFTESDARTDIYALGVLLNMMLTGHLPNEQLPHGAVGRIVKKATAIDPGKRYQSAAKLAKDLQDISYGDTKADSLFPYIPGFRCGKAGVTVLSVIAHFFMFIFIAWRIYIVRSFADGILSAVIIVFVIGIPYFCFTNAFNIWDRLPFASGASRNSQRGLYYFIGSMSYSVYAFVYWTFFWAANRA